MTDEPELQHHPADKPLRLRNATCVYCGVEFGPEEKRTKEHVIAREFVPVVDFNGQWNLIVNACCSCNNEKADLEGEIAALTMQPDVLGRFATGDERVRRALLGVGQYR
jgi:5-methylcytosine-specific restriction endonuclease McrA